MTAVKPGPDISDPCVDGLLDDTKLFCQCGFIRPDLTATAIKLKGAGYRIYTAAIPAAITPRNRLLMGVHALSVHWVGWRNRPYR
jgi:hypothetical protein